MAPNMQYPKFAAAAQMNGSGSWFMSIAVFSVINTVIFLAQLQIHFILGMGITEGFDAMGSGAGATGKVVAVFFDLIVVGIFVLFGYFAKKGHKWAFLTGMGIYLLDALLLVLFQDWLSVAFHAYALFRIFPGIAAATAYQEASRLEAQQPFAGAPQNPGVWPPQPSAPPMNSGSWPPEQTAVQTPPAQPPDHGA